MSPRIHGTGSLKPIIISATRPSRSQPAAPTWTTDPSSASKGWLFTARHAGREGDVTARTPYFASSARLPPQSRHHPWPLTADEEAAVQRAGPQESRDLIDAEVVLNADSGGVTTLSRGKTVKHRYRGQRKALLLRFQPLPPTPEAKVLGPVTDQRISISPARCPPEHAPFPVGLNAITRTTSSAAHI